MVHTHYVHPPTHPLAHMTTPTEDCEVCRPLIERRRREIFAAARLIRDSDQLNWMPATVKHPHLGTNNDRAEIALEYVRYVGAEYVDAATFDDQYQGVWSTFSEWAENYVESTGMLDGVHDSIKYYFDTEKFARDLKLGGDYSEIPLADGRIVVVSNH